MRVRVTSEWLLALPAAVALAFVLWQPLWFGEGFVGGDLYPYYFPQKQFLADSLQRGELPLWNDLTGHGYPVLGESQTGACYPLHWLTYGVLDVQTAWNAVHIVHYIAAFVALWLFARRSGLELAGALLAALVYVYGWFPARACLEWAILGGVYLPLALWCVEGWLQSRRAAFLAGLSIAVGLQLLGGHYQIAFYTWLTLALYVPARVWMSPRAEAEGLQPLGFLCAALLTGILLGGVQLLPTWELKQRSQRTIAGVEHDPNYGHIPPQYLAQLVNPWYWYDPQRDLDAELQRLRWAALPTWTNRVEAHLYIGQIPLYLALGGVLALFLHRPPLTPVPSPPSAGERARVRGRAPDSAPLTLTLTPHQKVGRGDPIRWTLLWLVIVALATLVAIGWLQPIVAHLPGFSYFRGVGRIGIVITLGLALLAGRALDELLAVTPAPLRRLLAVALIGITVVDLAWWPARINYAVIVPNPPIRARDASPIRALLQREPDQPVRLYAPGANIANLLGAASTPVYLGLGPREYFDPQFTIPRAANDDFHAFTPEREGWLRRAGVTHILSFEPLEQRGWSADPLWTGFDPLLNPAWARFHEPLYLYRLRDAPGRLYWDVADEAAGLRPRGSASDIELTTFTPQHVAATVIAPEPRRLVLADLAWPGWQTRIDGKIVTGLTAGMFRAVEIPSGTHTVDWSYRPATVYWGLFASGLGAMGLCVIAWFASRRRAAPEAQG
jgi:hypothetical protein